MDKVAADFMRDTGNTVTTSWAGSNARAKQIIQGAPADLFISASEEWMAQVEIAGLVQDRTHLSGNRLVLIGHGDAPPLRIGADTDLPGLLDGRKLAMAPMAAVPAVQYGKAALESLGLWNSIAANVAQVDNVRAALAIVATGEAPYGIVYATDVMAEDDVTLTGEFPADSHPAITYPAALLTGADDAGRTFYEALRGDAADSVWIRHGFMVAN